MPRANMFGDMIRGGAAASEAALQREGTVPTEDRADLLQRIDVLELTITQLRVDIRKLTRFRDAVWTQAYEQATKERE